MAAATSPSSSSLVFAPQKGPILRSIPLYGKECLDLLQEIVLAENDPSGTVTNNNSTTTVTLAPKRGRPTETSASEAAAAAGRSSSDSNSNINGGSARDGYDTLNHRNIAGNEANDDSGASTSSIVRHEGGHGSSSSNGGSSNSESNDDDDDDESTRSGDDSESSGSEAAEGAEFAPVVDRGRADDCATTIAGASADQGGGTGHASANVPALGTDATRKGNRTSKSKNKRERQTKTESEYRRHVESIPCHPFHVPPRATTTSGAVIENASGNDGGGTDVVLCVPNCLTPDRNTKDDISNLLSRRYDDETNSTNPTVREAKALLSLLQQSQSQDGLVVVIWWMRSGRFAGGVFVNDTCVAHSTKARYTTRKGQGKSQSAMDNQKGKNIKSVGAQLRRAGQVQLWDDVRNVAVSWTSYLQKAHLVFVMVPTVMHGHLWKETFASILTKDDDRVRTRVPLNLKKPGFDSVVMVHRVLTTCTIRQQVHQVAARAAENDQEKRIGAGTAAPKNNQQDAPKIREDETDEVVWPPWTPLHEAAAKGRVEALVALLGQPDVNVNAVAGPLLQTPLHVAAAADFSSAVVTDVEGDANGVVNVEAEDEVTGALGALSADDGPETTHEVNVTDAAECVYQLLVTGGADPTVTDIRNRVPYFLASSESVRVAFRRARAVLERGDSAVAWDWDAAKVGPALTDQELEARKEKEAEKKRQKKQRQKERKAKDKAAAEAMERQRQQQAEEQRMQEEAKRIRDGLQPKANIKATNVCDFCQKVCVGKRRRDMYQRLEYAYCSAECVQKHKRELMAAAAMARFQS